ncbi:unnamed protein product [Peniophora sp. CBMAI 1063]|nr:unnamed protein product [Peniophora sp. CBMAI 1063]
MPPPHGSTISSGPDKALARNIAEANLFLCKVNLRTFQDTFAWADLAAAFRHGEASARLGLFGTASYMAVSKIKKFVLAQIHIGDRMSGPPPDTGLPPITSAQDAAYVDEILWCLTLAKGAAPSAHYEDDSDDESDEDVLACGRPGCDNTTTTPSDFKRCGGKCPMHLKPYYCSKECQKQDWQRHKAECRRLDASEEKHITFTTLQGKQAELDLSGLKNSKVEVAKHVAGSYDFVRKDKRVPPSLAAFFGEMEAAASENKNGQTPEEFVRMIEKWPKHFVLPHH